jgi:hypothetical protein
MSETVPNSIQRIGRVPTAFVGSGDSIASDPPQLGPAPRSEICLGTYCLDDKYCSRQAGIYDAYSFGALFFTRSNGRERGPTWTSLVPVK